VEVIVSIFSGRPDPKWDLTSIECKQLKDRFKALQEIKDVPQISEGLGYRGITVRDIESEMIYDEFTVVSGVVVAKKTGILHYFKDLDQKLELWLLGTGQGKLEGSLYDTIHNQIKGETSSK
jgi:hypothetical protein